MKRLFVTGSVLLFLTACAQTNAALDIRVSPSGQARREELLQAARRVVERRFEQQKQALSAMQLTPEGSGAVLRFAARDAAATATVFSGLQAPLGFRVMVEAPKEEASYYDERFGGFNDSGITERHLDWAAAGVTESGLGTAMITLTQEGQGLLQKLYAENLDKEIGIFVRGRLMSRKKVTTKDAEATSLQVDGIPTPEIAAVFADDVNVGAHVIFTPLEAPPLPPPSSSSSSVTPASGSSSSISLPNP